MPVDEAHEGDGTVREHYRAVLGADLIGARERIAAEAEAEPLRHGDHVLHLDAVPRVIPAAEWDALAAGLLQRARALEAFVADCYGERRAVAEGIVGQDLLDTCPYYEDEGIAPATWIGVAGPDVVRDEDGDLVVLEDNVRTPTLMAYAAWARAHLDDLPGDPRPFEAPLLDGLRQTLERARASDGLTVLLGDGPDDMLGWEARWLADRLGVPLAGPEDLRVEKDRLRLTDGREVAVAYRRTGEERVRGTWLGDLVLGPLRAGTLTLVNAPGTGVADDKRTHAHVEDLVRFFCGEEPLVRSVPTLDLGDERHRQEALERMDELVFKRRTGSGGHGLVLGPHASRGELEDLRAELEAEPGAFVAQELLRFSTHPTVIDGRLQPRHVDLRAFVLPAAGTVVPGGLSRVALAEGDLVVNCSQGGGGKDTWVL